jgi:hypothetical protein
MNLKMLLVALLIVGFVYYIFYVPLIEGTGSPVIPRTE